MRSLIMKQAERFLRERKNYKRWLSVFFCLAAVVALSTVMVLRYTGTAMTGDLQCGMEEHIHTEECFQEELICGQEAGEEHEHTEECYEKQLVCVMEEHVHEDACYAQEEEAEVQEADDGQAESDDGAEAQDQAGADGGAEVQEQTEALTDQETGSDDGRHTLTVQGEDYTVTVSYGDEAGIPENTELLVQEILKDSDGYEAYYQEMLTAMAREESGAGGAEDEAGVSSARFFDITFMADGVEVKPAAPVDIKVSYPGAAGSDENGSASVVHFAEEGAEVLDAETVENGEGRDFEFTQEN